MYAMSCRLGRLGAAVLVLASLAACDIAVNGEGGLHFDIASGKAQDHWNRTYKVNPGARLELINVNGRIEAEASDGAEIEIRAERTAKAATNEGAKELLGQIEMREEVGDDRVRVEVRPPRTRGPSGHEIKWTVRVPRGIAVDLRTVNGGVKMDRLQGDVRARTTNGGIVGTALASSAVDAAVTNGGVEIELVNAISSGSVSLEAVNGGVVLSLPPDSKADISGRCVNGGIEVTGLDVMGGEGDGETHEQRVQRLQRMRRRLDGTLNGGGAKISLETVNGGVKIARSGKTS
jgi:hypothetical protein